METDENILIPKSKSALEKYGHQVVIGNLLTTRKRHVVFVYGNGRVDRCDVNEEEFKEGVEIEEKIVAKLLQNHKEFIEKNLSPKF